RYQNGLLNAKNLAEFEVKATDEHSLVRIQPEIVSSQSMRSVNLGVAITPVRRAFVVEGPWGSSTWLNGVNASAVIRCSGDNTTVLQFGLALSFFLNRSMLINGG